MNELEQKKKYGKIRNGTKRTEMEKSEETAKHTLHIAHVHGTFYNKTIKMLAQQIANVTMDYADKIFGVHRKKSIVEKMLGCAVYSNANKRNE